MSNYFPDNWVVLKIKGKDPHYKVLAGWSGGYTTGDSWRINSGIVSAKKIDDTYEFIGSSGSAYVCSVHSYGLRMNNGYIWDRLKDKHKELIELMPEDTDWLNVDWIIR